MRLLKLLSDAGYLENLVFIKNTTDCENKIKRQALPFLWILYCHIKFSLSETGMKVIWLVLYKNLR